MMLMEKTSGNGRMTGLQKFFYGCGEGASTFATTAVGMFYLYFLTDIVDIRPSLAGSVVLLGNIWDAVTDPFVGWLSDRSDNRFGRRRIWILGSTIPFAASFALIWTVPTGAGQLAAFLYATAAFMVFIFMITSYMVPYTTLAMELTSDYDERNQLAMWRMVFSIGLALPATVLPKLLIDRLPDERSGFMAMGWILAACMLPLAALVVFAGRERKPREDAPRFIESLRSSFGFPPFRKALMMYIFAMLPLRLLMAAIIYYFNYYLLSPDSFEVSMAIMMVASVASLFLWDAVSRRLDKKRAYIIGLTTCAGLLLVLMLPKGAVLKLLMPFSVVMGLGISALHIMPVAIVPEAIDAGIAEGLAASEGIWNGVITFAHKISAAVAAFAMGLILDFAGYVPGVEAQKPSAVAAILFLVCIAPAALSMAGVVVARGFGIDRSEAKRIEEKIG